MDSETPLLLGANEPLNSGFASGCLAPQLAPGKQIECKITLGCLALHCRFHIHQLRQASYFQTMFCGHLSVQTPGVVSFPNLQSECISFMLSMLPPFANIMFCFVPRPQLALQPEKTLPRSASS